MSTFSSIIYFNDAVTSPVPSFHCLKVVSKIQVNLTPTGLLLECQRFWSYMRMLCWSFGGPNLNSIDELWLQTWCFYTTTLLTCYGGGQLLLPARWPSECLFFGLFKGFWWIGLSLLYKKCLLSTWTAVMPMYQFFGIFQVIIPNAPERPHGYNFVRCPRTKFGQGLPCP